MRRRAPRSAALTLVPAAALALTSLTVPAAAAADTVLCGSRPATIVGTDADDVLVGTAGPDVIAGLGGDDELRGLGGDDVLCGGEGADRLLGGAGDDVLRGEEPGVIELDGGDGGLRLVGNWLEGGSGADTYRQGSHDDGHFASPDHISFANASGVRVTMSSGKARGQGKDRIVEFRGRYFQAPLSIIGSAHDDVVVGGARRLDVYPGPGDDRVETGFRGKATLGGDRIDEGWTTPRGDALVPAWEGVPTGDDVYRTERSGRTDVLLVDGRDDLRGGAGQEDVTVNGGKAKVRTRGGADTVRINSSTRSVGTGPGKDKVYVSSGVARTGAVRLGTGRDRYDRTWPVNQTSRVKVRSDRGWLEDAVGKSVVASAEKWLLRTAGPLKFTGTTRADRLDGRATRLTAALGAGDDSVSMRISSGRATVAGGKGRDRVEVWLVGHETFAADCTGVEVGC